MSDAIARDLKLHLSQSLQSTIRDHARRAELVLEPADTLMMMLGASVDAACCAIASIAGTLSQNPEVTAAELVTTLAAKHAGMVAAAVPVMIARIAEAVDKREAAK